MPVVVRNGELVIEALAVAREPFAFALRGVDFDNDGAFMNYPVVDWCRAQGLEVTRSRAYSKNDQPWVEQKNGSIVRRLVGYGRFEGMAAAQALARLHAAARLHTNLFQPSFKPKEKKRIGARVIKRYHSPVPPVDRVLAHMQVTDEAKDRLRQLRARADRVSTARGDPHGSGRARGTGRSPRERAGAPSADRCRSRPLCRQPQDGMARRRTAADASPSVLPPQAGSETALDARPGTG
jgi:hypothetical protein